MQHNAKQRDSGETVSYNFLDPGSDDGEDSPRERNGAKTEEAIRNSSMTTTLTLLYFGTRERPLGNDFYFDWDEDPTDPALATLVRVVGGVKRHRKTAIPFFG